ncbi:MAG: metallophosphoesterase [Verrucomicrobiota bacterium]
MRVLIIGDVHGRHQELADVLRQVQTDYRIEAGIQVGDYGFYKDVMVRAREQKVRYPVPVHVIDGNHEDHAWLRRALLTGAASAWQKEANLIYQPRPSVTRLGASKIGFMGGALYVDRPQKHNLLSRFPNYILRRHREQAVALFNREKPDLIVTHSCPAGIGIGVRGSPDLEHGVTEHIVKAGFDPGPPDDCGEMELAQLWRDLCYRPRGWVFGHFHCTHEAVVEGTRFVCVGDDLNTLRQRLVLWDTEEKKLLTVRV